MHNFLFPTVVATIVVLWMFVLDRLRIPLWSASNENDFVKMGSNQKFVGIWLPVIIPLLALFSAGVHLNEGAWFANEHSEHCLLHHETNDWIVDEALVFVLPMLVLMVMGLYLVECDYKLYRTIGRGRIAEQELSVYKRLGIAVDGRIWVSDSMTGAAGVVGFLFPKIVFHPEWLKDVNDSLLKATWQHETIHLEQRDPLRFAVLFGLGRIPMCSKNLGMNIQRWIHARESYVDQEAVHRGAHRLDLAEAIVQSIRWQQDSLKRIQPDTLRYARAYLQGTSKSMLYLRVQMLLDHSRYSRREDLHRHGQILLCICLVGWLFVSHVWGAEFLEWLHTEIERTLMP